MCNIIGTRGAREVRAKYEPGEEGTPYLQARLRIIGLYPKGKGRY